jgi:hypothetical protein
MQWDSYPARIFDGRSYGMKSASFTPYLTLPASVSGALRLAVGSESAPREQLAAHGWELRDPLAVTLDPWTYQEFIQQSVGEFSVAKAGYVDSNSGWFSERSAAYLASGRPVVVQETGFSRWLRAADGVLPFTSADEARAQIDRVLRDPLKQAHAARAAAETWFDSDHVLQSLLDRISTRA